MERLQSCFAHNVRYLREKLGFSQKHLAALAKLSLSTIREIEAGRRSPGAKNLDNLSRALGTRPCKLLFDREQMELYDKYEHIASYYRELSAAFNAILDETTAKYLKASGVM